MRLPPQGDHRLDLGRRAEFDVGLAEIAGVGEHCFRLAESLGQGLEPLQHRLDLLLVIGGLNHLRGDDEEAVRRHHRLSVVALATARAAFCPCCGQERVEWRWLARRRPVRVDGRTRV
jgi:hypothetical protein